ncbi:7-deoxyloganetin glucosyltransferase-like [Punica granatum]|uniref:7-deoxyloganetin glucosyltransferase-like n=1 Tax=Punica granatum TaxID=22663 RepID=A0A6P8BTB9_PUNGR|nr:7-deoxyloganetin glucosyltransferase-like [Punica granatum]
MADGFMTFSAYLASEKFGIPVMTLWTILRPMPWFDKASATIIHTFEALERDVLSAMSSMASKPVHVVGPFQLLIDRIPENENQLKHIGYNLWKKKKRYEVFSVWLDSQIPESVLHITLRSVAFFTSQQLIEFGMEIDNSKYPLLWIIRPDLVNGDSGILPSVFNEETKGRAFIIARCLQEEVLDHPSE